MTDSLEGESSIAIMFLQATENISMDVIYMPLPHKKTQLKK